MSLAVKPTWYERNGYHMQRPRRQTECRVADLARTNYQRWMCVRHNRHILKCLNERAEADLLRLRVLHGVLTARLAAQNQAEGESHVA